MSFTAAGAGVGHHSSVIILLIWIEPLNACQLINLFTAQLGICKPNLTISIYYHRAFMNGILSIVNTVFMRTLFYSTVDIFGRNVMFYAAL